MATTRLMPLHAGKGRNTGSAIRSVIGYVSNPGKTRNGELVTGFACDPRTADGEFLLAKREYLLRTGRVRGKDDVIAYHLRQSFFPGEVTPEQANQIGQELEAEFGIRHLPSDFKKQNGYLRSLQLSEEYGLNRQDYCGCEFSAKARG